MAKIDKRWVLAGLVLIAAVGGYAAWKRFNEPGLPSGIASGNGRIEATEIDISALSAGRLDKLLVAEGDLIQHGQVLARMDIVQLEAQRRQAEAERDRARISVETANAVVAQREAEKRQALAVVDQYQSALDVADRRLQRSEALAKNDNLSKQTLDNDRGGAQQAKAALAAAEAQSAAADAGIGAARAAVVDANAAVAAAEASIDAIASSINDSTLTSPRDGRVQYLVAREGEVLAGGGRVLNLVDLADVYMTFFLPTAQAGRLAVGSEARIVLDAAPQDVIPAVISFVADVAQFTPKTVETADEREKLMFRVRARVSPDLLRKYLDVVKTGLPGTAYVKIDADTEWPENLRNVVQ
ncbi:MULTISPECIES: HlyD family secretion protein [Haematobacter]|uniref:Glycoside hydrolase family 43 n=1 Tax=Haematobacter genomosp. 1 TaxID=366618 RepID=A0A212AE01_9RHOB|nr:MULTISPECIES: efflux RND transporter periplasmic adaptor subunit [Haematobacter]OWJ79478.1 glycoside hydrolase family 43 [Haematobacter genomosp. 1]